jgi:hypothetical protein
MLIRNLNESVTTCQRAPWGSDCNDLTLYVCLWDAVVRKVARAREGFCGKEPSKCPPMEHALTLSTA